MRSKVRGFDGILQEENASGGEFLAFESSNILAFDSPNRTIL
jgi:hypothetical protein